MRWRYFRPGQRMPAKEAFEGVLVAIWRVDDECLRKRLWYALAQDHSAHGQTWRWELTKLRRSYDDHAFADDLIERSFSPHAAIHWLERCVQSIRLQRSEANAVMECILARTKADGTWK